MPAPALILHALADEAALFAAVGYLLFALDDLVVDLLYFARRGWRALTVYARFPRSYADQLIPPAHVRSGFLAVFIPAWDEEAVIGAMLRTALDRIAHDDYRLFVGVYRNDPKTRRAVAEVDDPRILCITVTADGPTTKADCLNRLYQALLAEEIALGRRARAVVLHDAEDVIHPLELRTIDALIDRAGAIQLPVQPLPDPRSRWIAGHYVDEFAESHGKDLIVREAIGASVPLAGVGCALARPALERLAGAHDGQPFDPHSLTEDYELGLRLGALGLRTMFVRLPAYRGRRGVVATRAMFPAQLDSAVRQKSRWIGGIAYAGWDRMGWSGGLAERWMRMRDRRAPLAALLIATGYLAVLVWSQLALATMLGAPAQYRPDPALATLVPVNLALLAWRLAMRAGFTASAHGWREGLRAIARMPVANLICVLANLRAAVRYERQTLAWEKTAHEFPRSTVPA